MASIYLFFFFNKSLDFPGDTVDKILPANAGDIGLIADLEKPHMPGATKLVCHNYRAQEPTTAEARVLRACAQQQEKPLQWKAPAHCH